MDLMRTYAKVFQQGKASKTVHIYGEALERSWGGFAKVLSINLIMIADIHWNNRLILNQKFQSEAIG